MQLWLNDCPTENTDPDSIWIKSRDFVAYGGKEGIWKCVVVEDTMDAPLGTIACAYGL